MRPGGGKSKGSAYERAVAKVLAAAFYPEGDGVFQRIYSHPIPTKGETRSDLKALRYITIDIDSGEKALVADSSWPFVVECKNYKDVRHFFSGLYAKDTELFDWMWQATQVAQDEKKMPLVIFKLFRAEHIAMLSAPDFHKLGEIFGTFPTVQFSLVREEPTRWKSLKLVLLRDLLEWIDWGVYKVSAGKYIRSLVPK